ncbi:hypothetical protein RYX36_030489 [Vicia faba]
MIYVEFLQRLSSGIMVDWVLRLLLNQILLTYMRNCALDVVFVLRLPVPRSVQMLDLVGTNGIGKSTALKVLARKLNPNLGRFTVRTKLVFYGIDTCEVLLH